MGFGWMGVGAGVLYGAPGGAAVGDRLVVGKESGAAGVDKRSRLSNWPTCFRARLLGIQPRSQAARPGPGRGGLVGSRQPLYVVTDFPFYGFLRRGPLHAIGPYLNRSASTSTGRPLPQPPRLVGPYLNHPLIQRIIVFHVSNELNP